MSKQTQIQTMFSAVMESWPEMTTDQRKMVIEARGRELMAVLGQIPGLLSGTHQTVPIGLSWREKDDVIYFTVVSDGTTGEQWIVRLKKKGVKLSDNAKEALCSPDFNPTSNVPYEIAVLKGTFFDDNDRTTKTIRTNAKNRRWITPNAEVACLIRDKFTNQEIKAMDLTRIVTMHNPITDSDDYPRLLGASRDADGSCLDAYWDIPNSRWHCTRGFAFEVVSRVSRS